MAITTPNFVPTPMENLSAVPKPASASPEVTRRTPAQHHHHHGEASAMPLPPPHMPHGHFCCGEPTLPHQTEVPPQSYVPGLQSYANKVCAHKDLHFCQNLADSNTGLCGPCAYANSTGQPCS